MRRRRSEPANHQEEKVPWASYADALAGLLFVFILLALSFAYRLQQARNQADAERVELSQKVEQAQRSRRIAQDLVDTDETSENRHASVARCLSDALGENAVTRVQPKATLEEARLSLYLYSGGEPSIEWFSSGYAWLEPGPCAVAQQIGPCLEQAFQHAQLAKSDREFQLRVFVEGHTDAVPVVGGPAAIPTNWELSGARAAAVVRAFLVPKAHGRAGASCDAIEEPAKALQRRIAAGDLEVVAVGLADRKPAWRRLCDEAASDPICICLGENGGQVGTCQTVLQEDAVANGGPPDALPSEQLIAWANRELPGDPDGRRRLLRRVDLRFEVTPREVIGQELSP